MTTEKPDTKTAMLRSVTETCSICDSIKRQMQMRASWPPSEERLKNTKELNHRLTEILGWLDAGLDS